MRTRENNAYNEKRRKKNDEKKEKEKYSNILQTKYGF